MIAKVFGVHNHSISESCTNNFVEVDLQFEIMHEPSSFLEIGEFFHNTTHDFEHVILKTE
jgi:hypothetical protein